MLLKIDQMANIKKIIKEKKYKPKIILTGGLAQIYKKEIVKTVV